MLDKTVQRAVFKYSFHTFFNRVVRTVTRVMHMEAVTNVELITIYSVCVGSFPDPHSICCLQYEICTSPLFSMKFA